MQFPIAITLECANIHGMPKLVVKIQPDVKYAQYVSVFPPSMSRDALPKMMMGNGHMAYVPTTNKGHQFAGTELLVVNAQAKMENRRVKVTTPIVTRSSLGFIPMVSTALRCPR